MAFDVILAPQAAEDMKALKASLRAEVRDALETHLGTSRKKRAAAASSGYAGYVSPNTGSVSETFTYSAS